MTDIDSNSPGISHGKLLEMTSQIVASYAGANTVAATELENLISTVFRSLASAGMAQPQAKEPAQKPAVPVKKSVTPDYIVCLEDGKKLKMLKRHLRSTYGMTPDEYRAKWDLPPDYPMVAPNYAARRSDFAKSIGLGRKRTEAEAPAKKPSRRKSQAA